MSWHSRVRNVIAVALAVAGVVGTTPATAATVAAAAPSQQSVRIQTAAAGAARLRAEIKLLDPYVVTRADGTLALSPPASISRQVNAGDMATLRNGLVAVNQKIGAGELVSTAGHQLVDPKAVDFSVQWNQTKRVTNWWGMQYYFSQYWTSKLEGLANMGAAAGALCAFIAALYGAAPIAILCAVASAILWFGAGWLQWADNGGGDIIAETWTPFPAGGIWISGQ